MCNHLCVYGSPNDHMEAKKHLRSYNIYVHYAKWTLFPDKLPSFASFFLWSRNTHYCYLSICSQHLTGVPNEHFSQNWLYDVVNASKVLLRQPMLIFKFLGKKNPLFTARVGWFSRALTCFARSNIHIKNYSAIARRKNIPFYPARTGINFSYFQLARRSFRFPSQLISQCFFFPASCPSSNSAWRAGISSSGSVGYSWLNLLLETNSFVL